MKPAVVTRICLYDWTFKNGGVVRVGDEAGEAGVEGAAEASV